MNKNICSNCRFSIQDFPDLFCTFRKLSTKDGLFIDCHCFLPKTLFDRITESPVVLAPKFVYHVTSFLDGLDNPKKIWYSTIIHGRFFDTETEAKRATVAKLTEVEK